MIFSVSNDGIQWTLDFGPDSVTSAVIELVQNITIRSQKILLVDWQLLFSQRQDFLDNHLPRVPVTQNQEGTMDMRDEGGGGSRLGHQQLSSIRSRRHRV